MSLLCGTHRYDENAEIDSSLYPMGHKFVDGHLLSPNN